MSNHFFPNLQLWVMKLILVQFALVMFLTLCTLVLLALRNATKKVTQKKEDAFRDFLAVQMCQHMENQPLDLQDENTVRSLRRFHQPKYRKAVRTVLLEQFKLVSGAERNFLISEYVKYGFSDEDIQKCKSIFWWQRLNAVIHLGSLNLNEMAGIFEELLTDPEPIVATSAALSLSFLTHPLNSPDLITKLPLGLNLRQDALFEVISNIGTRHGTEPIAWAIRHHPSQVVRECGIRALKKIGSFEASKVLNDLLTKPSQLKKETIIEIIQALDAIGDPSALTSVRPYLSHFEPAIRAQSALFLMKTGDPESQDKILSLRSDESVEIKRMFQVYEIYQKAVA